MIFYTQRAVAYVMLQLTDAASQAHIRVIPALSHDATDRNFGDVLSQCSYAVVVDCFLYQTCVISNNKSKWPAHLHEQQGSVPIFLPT